MKGRFARVAIRSAAAAAIAIAGEAAAQVAPSPSPLTAGSVDPTPVPQAAAGTEAQADIVVTAQRRSERLQDVPISINVVNDEALKKNNIVKLEDIGTLAPAVQISRTGVYTQPSIRGVTTLQSAQPENNVAIYIDGFYQLSGRSLNLDLQSVSSVSVLKGPQGTLFGRNATGGAILVDTFQPSLTDVHAQASLGYGRFDDKRAQAYLSVPLSSTVAFNVAGSYRASDGYIRDVSGFDSAPQRAYTANAKLLFEPSNNLKLTLGFRYAQVEDGRSLAYTEEGRVTAALVVPGTTFATGDNQTSLNHAPDVSAKQFSYTLKGEYNIGPVTLSSLTMYQYEHDFNNLDADGTKTLYYDQYNPEYYKVFTQEVNVRSNGSGRLQYTGGAFFFLSRVSLGGVETIFYPSTVYRKLNNETAQQDDAIAAYGDVTWQPIDRIFITGGLRYSSELRRAQATTQAGVVANDDRRRFNSFTPRVVVRYEIDRRSSVYASFSRGFKSGFINNVAPFLPVYPEGISAYEVGYKNIGRSLTFSTAAYYYNYTNLQVGSIVVLNNLANSIVSNAANARIYGAEGALSYPVTPDFVLSANLAYTHARYRSFPNAPVSLPNPVTGLNSATCGAQLCQQDWSGLRIARAPDWSGNVGGTYTVHAGRSSVDLTANVAFTSFYLPTKTDIGLNGTGYRYGQPGYALLNLNVGWNLPGGRWRLSAFGNNVTDKLYYIVKTGSAFGDYHVYGEPATWGIRADYRF